MHRGGLCIHNLSVQLIVQWKLNTESCLRLQVNLTDCQQLLLEASYTKPSYWCCTVCNNVVFIIFVANWCAEPKSACLLWRALQQLGTWQHTTLPLWHTLLYSSFCSQLADTCGKSPTPHPTVLTFLSFAQSILMMKTWPTVLQEFSFNEGLAFSTFKKFWLWYARNEKRKILPSICG